MKKRKTHEGRNNVKRDNDIPVKILRHWKKEGGRNIVLPRKEILIRPDERLLSYPMIEDAHVS